jgi:hypothetical protein
MVSGVVGVAPVNKGTLAASHAAGTQRNRASIAEMATHF